jgi:hypothetical protein
VNLENINDFVDNELTDTETEEEDDVDDEEDGSSTCNEEEEMVMTHLN